MVSHNTFVQMFVQSEAEPNSFTITLVDGQNCCALVLKPGKPPAWPGVAWVHLVNGDTRGEHKEPPPENIIQCSNSQARLVIGSTVKSSNRTRVLIVSTVKSSNLTRGVEVVVAHCRRVVVQHVQHLQLCLALPQRGQCFEIYLPYYSIIWMSVWLTLCFVQIKSLRKTILGEPSA